MKLVLLVFNFIYDDAVRGIMERLHWLPSRLPNAPAAKEPAGRPAERTTAGD